MAINEKNYDKYKELMGIYKKNYDVDKIIEDYPEESKKADIKIFLSIIIPIVVMIGGMVLFANVLPIKAFFPLTGVLILGSTITGCVKTVNAMVYKANIPVEVFKKENPKLKLYSKETLAKKIAKYEEYTEIKEKEFEEEKYLHQIPKEIGLDFALASKKISTEEKIALLEKEKTFWETVLLEEQNEKSATSATTEAEPAYQKVLVDSNK